jgi:CBS domain-containing protein
MRIGEVCPRLVVHCPKDASALDAAKMMRNAHIVHFVALEFRDAKKGPVGIITDRDIVVQLVAKELNPDEIATTDLMSRELFVALEGRHSRCDPAHALSRCAPPSDGWFRWRVGRRDRT